MARIWCTTRSGFHLASSIFQGPRDFGFSRPPYQSLNLGSKVGDEFDRVIANRKELSKACQLDEIRFMDQIHSALMVEGKVERSEASCDGIFLRREKWNERVGIAVQMADCVPLILHGENLISAVHVGREGLVRGMTESALDAISVLTSVDRISAVIGPSICGNCYPLSEETYLAAAERYPKSVFSKSERKIDVAAGVISVLERRNVHWSWLGGLRECVSCDHSYYSYRRDRVTGRQAMVVAWG